MADQAPANSTLLGKLSVLSGQPLKSKVHDETFVEPPKKVQFADENGGTQAVADTNQFKNLKEGTVWHKLKDQHDRKKDL